nr:glycosyltransferase [Lachnospiraceae bacterium]
GKRPWPALSSEAAMLYKQADETIAKQAGYLSYEEYFGINVLTRKLAEMERLTALNRLSAAHPVTVFTSSHSPHLSSINGHVFPAIDYQTDMYKVFHLSRINLNFTMPSIESGIPLRVFDIMSVGGFCLTNYQAELDDLFTVGKDLDVFHDTDELIEKCLYYLMHEDERLRIAINGYQAVREKHTFQHRLQAMLRIADMKKS